MKLIVLILGACGNPGASPPGEDSADTAESPGDSGSRPESTSDSGEHDTGPMGKVDCDNVPFNGVHLTPAWAVAVAGKRLDAGDIDEDGRIELFVTESYDMWDDVYGYHGGTDAMNSTVYIEVAPSSSGALGEAASTTYSVDDFTGFFGAGMALLSESRQVAIYGWYDGDCQYMTYPASTSLGVVDETEYIGRVCGATGFSSTLGRCGSAGGEALCMADQMSDGGGLVTLIGAPIVGDVSLDDAWGRYYGDEGEHAQFSYGEADLDADGIRDLIVGAIQGYDTRGVQVGRVAVLLDPPAGEHRVWDAATATITSTIEHSEFGGDLSAGDLDGDGYPEALVSDIVGTVYVFSGPFGGGDRLDVTAEWTLTDDTDDWATALGSAMAVADVDRNDGADLLVGMPYSTYYSAEDAPPGEVLVYSSPAPGVYTPAEADRALTSGLGLGDALGTTIEAGDLDGDGLVDIATGAPRDPCQGEYAGAVDIFYGSAW